MFLHTGGFFWKSTQFARTHFHDDILSSRSVAAELLRFEWIQAALQSTEAYGGV
jgi:hypothetical protein